MTGAEQTIKIELNENDARLFVEFQKHYEAFKILYLSGLFDIKNGNAVVNFDKNGVLQEISEHRVKYKRGLTRVDIVIPIT